MTTTNQHNQEMNHKRVNMPESMGCMSCSARARTRVQAVPIRLMKDSWLEAGGQSRTSDSAVRAPGELNNHLDLNQQLIAFQRVI